jgi:hypothetical protein
MANYLYIKIFLALFLWNIYTNANSQNFIRDSAMVITFYTHDRHKSNDSLLIINIYQVIDFFSKSRVDNQQLLLQENDKSLRWNERKWIRRLNLKRWIAFVNKLPSSSYTVQNLTNSNLRNQLLNYDSVNKYVNGANINLVRSVSFNSFIKAYIIYCEGYIDSTTPANLTRIYHGPNKSFSSYETKLDIIRQDKINDSINMATVNAIVEIRINQKLCKKKSQLFFIETKGHIVKEFELIEIK